MVGILGNGGLYWSCGANIRWRCNTILPWIGGGVVELYIYPIRTRSARQSIGCGGREDMGGSLGSTSPYDLGSTWMDRMMDTGLFWTLSIGFTAMS